MAGRRRLKSSDSPLLADSQFVFLVAPDPDANEIVAVTYCERAVIVGDSRRPEIPSRFEVEGRMKRVVGEKGVLLFGSLLNSFRQVVEVFPESGSAS
jgi:hypothetical protein